MLPHAQGVWGLGWVGLGWVGLGGRQPFVMSITSIMVSMIWAPPMMVRISEAWPGQSTSVNCSLSYGSSARCSGMSSCSDEKPRSKVMPRSLLSALLSNDAVEATVLSVLAARGEETERQQNGEVVSWEVSGVGGGGRVPHSHHTAIRNTPAPCWAPNKTGWARGQATKRSLAAVDVAEHPDIDVEHVRHLEADPRHLKPLKPMQ